jgi:hypothetical protein
VDNIIDVITNELQSPTEKTIAHIIEDVVNFVLGTPTRLWIALCCSAFTLITLLISTIFIATSKTYSTSEPPNWAFPLEIVQLIVIFVGSIGGALYAGELTPLCVPVDDAYAIAKPLLAVVSKELSKIFGTCPMSLGGVAVMGVAL